MLDRIRFITDRIANVTARTVSQRRRLFYASMLVISVRLALWAVPYRNLQKLTNVARRNRAGGFHDHSEWIIHDIVAAAQFIPGASCLTQALVAQILLRREGFDPRLQIGVGRNAAGTFVAHSWVECGGRIIIGEFTDVPYVPLAGQTEQLRRIAG